MKVSLVGLAGSIALMPAVALASQGVPAPTAKDLGGPVQMAVPSDLRLAQADASQPAQDAAPQPARAPLTPAQQVKGLYVTAGLGANWPMDNTAIEATNVFGQNYSFQEFHSSGISVETGVGYDFGDVRAEVTYAYDRSVATGYTDTLDGRVLGYNEYTTQPNINKNSVFASVYYDVNLKSRFSPYIGGGIGYSDISYSAAADQFASYAPFGAGAFAYQAKVGLTYLADRSTDVFAEAVFRGMTGYSGVDGQVTYDYSGFNSWGFLIGARYRFGIK